MSSLTRWGIGRPTRRCAKPKSPAMAISEANSERWFWPRPTSTSTSSSREMEVIGRPKYPFVLFSSSDDQALWLSGLIAGEKPRLGAYTADKEAIANLGVIVIDLSATEANDSLAHNKFAIVLPEFVNRLGDRLKRGDRLATAQGSFSETARGLTGSFGSLIGTTAGAVVTLPAYLLTLPARAAGG